ncbi:MAG: DUF4437 domain-containing protein [Planctomycetota bacterium]
MNIHTLVFVTSAACLASGCQYRPTTPSPSRDKPHHPGIEYLAAQDVDWTALNPARGDQSPQAADLWGDRAVDGATGFMVKFVDGFSSPPHIHNVTYRGVVLDGLVHNDDPAAPPMWMPAGSFWTQPAGDNHITAAKGPRNIAYIEIDAGPYLVQPSDEAFATAERPINVDASNLVWVEQPSGVHLAYLWGDPQNDQPAGLFLRLSPEFSGSIRTPNTPLRMVVVKGNVELTTDEGIVSLAPGSYFGTTSAGTLHLASDATVPAQLYLRAAGRFTVVRD